MNYYLLFMFIYISQSASGLRNSTDSFDRHWKGVESQPTFFDKDTFGVDIHPDPCTPMSRAAYRKWINARVQCTGSWCSYDSRFTCTSGSTNCYHVEHIIDSREIQDEPVFDVLNKDIAGNYVMAWGTWNEQLGRLKLSNGVMTRSQYALMEREKELVYGAHRLQQIRDTIKQCSKK